ncbi:MAG: polysulfide reductase NrfD, partial [Deltaproteobacteria bacterium]|nr:polysulfide reductase NrfD [Deltaproteobacteria bacterium]
GVRHNQNGRLITFVLVFLGNLAMHMEILLAGQSHPVGQKAEQFPEYISYFPSIWEWIVFMFSVAVMLLLFTLGERYLRLEEAHE